MRNSGSSFRWIIGTLISLLAAGGGIVALLIYFHPFQSAQPAFADGGLVKSGDQPAVYVVYGGAKFWIPSSDVFNEMGFHSDEVQTISDSAITAIPDVPSDGTLLKEFSTPSVYVMRGGAKHHVLSSASVVALGGWDKVHVVPDGALANIPNGDDIP